MGPVNLTNDPFNEKYRILEKIGEGSYSEVLKCKKRDSGDIFACKRLKKNYRNWNEVNEIAEIKSLRCLVRHPNILQMTEVHFDPSLGRVCLVFELMDKNLYELIKDRKRLLAEERVRVMMFQLMRALRHLHKHGIFHRDVKPENILLRPNDLLKLGDLGSVRGLYSKPPYTEYISTRWYRSPECLLTAGHYGFKMDIWAAGCVFYEVLTLRPLFPGSSELDQINRVHNILGPPPPRILQKFCNQNVMPDEVNSGCSRKDGQFSEEEKQYSHTSSKNNARLETIKKVLGNLNESKSRNFDWYFAPNKDPTGIDRLLPSHISTDARDLLRSLLQYDPDTRPSSHRVIQHQYFNDLRDKASLIAKEFGADDAFRPIVTIVGDAHATSMAMNDLRNIDLGKIGDHKMKIKMRRHEEKKTQAPNKADHPQAGMNKTLGNGSMDPNSIPSRRDETKSSIPKKINVGETTLKPKKPIVLASQSFNKENSILAERIPSLKYKYPPIEKLHVDSKGRDADVDTPGSSTTNPRTIHKPLIPEPKSKRALGGLGQLSSRRAEQKASLVALSQSPSKLKAVVFPQGLIDKNKMSSARLRRINENTRAMVQPIGGTDIKRSVLASDLPPISYIPRSLAKANKEVASVKQIQAQLLQQSLRSHRGEPVVPEQLLIPKPKKLEKNLPPVRYQSILDTRSNQGNQINLTEQVSRRRSNVGNTQAKMVAADLNLGRGAPNSITPMKSEIPTLLKSNVAQKSHRSWVDQGVRADANTIRNDSLMVGKLPVSKKQYPVFEPNKYDDDDEPFSYESPYLNLKLNDETKVKNQNIRTNNFDAQVRRRRSDLTYTKQSVIPPTTFTVQNHEQENLGRSVNVKALLAQQQHQRRLLEEQRVEGATGQYSTGGKKEEGEQSHLGQSYFSKEAQLLQRANAYQKQRANGPTGDQPQSFAATLADREKARQLGAPARKMNPLGVERSHHKLLPSHAIDDINTNARPPIGPRRLKPPVQRGIVEDKPVAQLLNQVDHYAKGRFIHNTNQYRKLEKPRSNQNIELEELRRDTARLRAARNDDVYFSSDDDAVTRFRQKAEGIISERAVEQRIIMENPDSGEDLRARIPPGKRLRRELRLRDVRESGKVQPPAAGSWNAGQSLREDMSYPASVYRSRNTKN